jgi:hypothetical protein
MIRGTEKEQARVLAMIRHWAPPRSAPGLNNWYALTGHVVALKVEADGDLHVALQDATGNKPDLACNSLMNELHQCLVFERFCKEA